MPIGRPLGGQVLAIVLDNGEVTGMVTVTDLRRAIRCTKLTTAGRLSASPKR